MAPAPSGGVAHDHEAGDLIDGIIHPGSAEGRAVATFVQATVGGAALKDTVSEPEGC